MEFFLQLLIQGLSVGFLYALAALGFVMIFKSSSVLNFAHGELLAIGAFIFLAFSVKWNLPIYLSFLLTLVGSFALGFDSVLNFAHGELLAIGAFIFLAFSVKWNLPIYLSFLLTLVGSFALGFVIERLFLRPLIGEALIEVIMLTVGLAAMFKGIMLFVFGGNLHAYPEFLPKNLSIQWGAINIPPVYVATFIIGILFLVIFGF